MPIHSDILQIIVDYLYTDEALAIKGAFNVFSTVTLAIFIFLK